MSGRFNPQHLALLDEALWVAENSVSDFFRLSEGFWLRHPYEVRTLAQLGPGEVAPQALAQLLKLSPEPGAKARRADFYRVCLQDDNCLGLLGREGEPGLFLPLMTYVLSHELVHLVRFAKFERLFEAHPSERAREEALVHSLTAKALADVRLPSLGRVLELYEKHGCDHWAAVA